MSAESGSRRPKRESRWFDLWQEQEKGVYPLARLANSNSGRGSLSSVASVPLCGSKFSSRWGDPRADTCLHQRRAPVEFLGFDAHMRKAAMALGMTVYPSQIVLLR